MKAEVAAAAQESAMRFEYSNFSRTQSDVMFSLDDFEGKFVTHFIPCVMFRTDISSPWVTSRNLAQPQLDWN